MECVLDLWMYSSAICASAKADWLGGAGAICVQGEPGAAAAGGCSGSRALRCSHDIRRLASYVHLRTGPLWCLALLPLSLA